jgi:hypothetical protein
MTSTLDANENGNPVYEYKASLAGGLCRFELEPHTLHWQVGRRSGRVRYDRLRAIRLSYRPVTMQSHRFVAEIWPTGGPKIQIVSVSWRSMMDQQRLDAAYVAFIAELHRRLAVAGAATQLSTGLPVVTYWIGVAVFAAVLFATASLAIRAARSAQWSTSAVVGLFFAVFAWQIGQFFYRNRPGRYRPDAIPAELMPSLVV